MAKQPTKPKPSADNPSDEYIRFERMTSALFRVDKRDVPKHEPKKRIPAPPPTTPPEQDPHA